MTSTDNQLFSAEEALQRLAETREQGCLSVHQGADMIQIYVQDGYIIRALGGGAKEGLDAVTHALHLTGSSYNWVRGIQPQYPEKNYHLNIKEILLQHGNINKTRVTETGKIASGLARKESESRYKYFLVHKDKPTEKQYLTKAATVIGRDKSSDIVIDHHDVSRRHCILDIQPRGLYLLDLNSSNGTFVNGILTSDGYLNHGDLIELGPYILVLNREQITPEK